MCAGIEEAPGEKYNLSILCSPRFRFRRSNHDGPAQNRAKCPRWATSPPIWRAAANVRSALVSPTYSDTASTEAMGQRRTHDAWPGHLIFGPIFESDLVDLLSGQLL